MKETDTKEVVPVESGLAELKPFEFEKAELIEFVSDYKNYVVTKETYAEAVKARAKIREKRYAIDKTLDNNNKILNEKKKRQKEMAGEFYDIVLPVEEHLDSGIKAVDQIKADEKARKEKEEADRLAKIEEEKRLAMEAELQAEKDRLEVIRVEQERVQKEQDEKAEALRLKEEAFLKKQEDDRKAAEAELLKKQLEAQAEIDRKNAEAKAELKKQEDELKARQKELALQEKEAIDKKKKEQDEANEKIRLEKVAIEKEKADLLAKAKQAEADKKAEEERIEADRLAKIEEEAEAKRQEALRPDKDKLLSFSSSLESMVYPELSGEPESKRVLEQVQATILGLQVYIREAVENI